MSYKHLFVAFRSNGEKNPRVKHYQIRQTETGEATYYLAEKYLFSTIPELIYYHQHNAAGKCARFPHATLLTQIDQMPKGSSAKKINVFYYVFVSSVWQA